MNKKEIEVQGLKIILVKKRVRNIITKIKDGEVVVSAPYYVSQAEVINVIEGQLDWIKKALNKAKNKNANAFLRYESGEKISFEGKEYTLYIVYNNKIKINKFAVDRSSLIIKIETPNVEDKEKIKTAIDKGFKKELKRRIDEFLPECEEITGQKVSAYTLRKMTTSWGLCHIKERDVVFSTQLARKNDEQLRYVIIHELTHLIEANHSSRFKEYMTKFMPDWRRIKRELNS